MRAEINQFECFGVSVVCLQNQTADVYKCIKLDCNTKTHYGGLNISICAVDVM